MLLIFLDFKSSRLLHLWLIRLRSLGKLAREVVNATFLETLTVGSFEQVDSGSFQL